MHVFPVPATLPSTRFQCPVWNELDPLISLLVSLQRSECAGIVLPFVSQKSGYTFARQSKPNLFSNKRLGIPVSQPDVLSFSGTVSPQDSAPLSLHELAPCACGRSIQMNILFQGFWCQNVLSLFITTTRINGISAKDLISRAVMWISTFWN